MDCMLFLNLLIEIAFHGRGLVEVDGCDFLLSGIVYFTSWQPIVIPIRFFLTYCWRLLFLFCRFRKRYNFLFDNNLPAERGVLIFSNHRILTLFFFWFILCPFSTMYFPGYDRRCRNNLKKPKTQKSLVNWRTIFLGL